MSSIEEEKRNILNREITLTELKEAIQKQKPNKTPGPDGLPGKLYQKLGESLELVLLEVCNEALLNAKIPESWRESYITLIPKEGTEVIQIKNYRPISLLNADYKIFMIIIAGRTKGF
uniref:Reverse transcriptase domain-containing protein n=1 Tax=Micrurus spixii TaxID=129469 RepID=A0A2D4LFX6_9SAUR